MKLPTLLQSASLGLDMIYILADEQGYIIEYNSDLAHGVIDIAVGQELFDVLPEFYGQEELLEEVRVGERKFLRFENMNRVTPSGELRYFRLTIVPAQGNLLILLLDMTELALHMQDLTQVRNELRLTERRLNITNQELQTLNNHLQNDVAMAWKIQQSLLLPPQPQKFGLDVVCYSTPARQVGGDFYTYHAFEIALTRACYAFAVGDVSGKGVSAALLMAACQSQLDASFSQFFTPTERMVYLDKAIETYTKSCRQNCAMVYVELEMISPLAGKDAQYLLHVVNAGCIPPYIKYRNGQVEQPEIGGFALGQGLGALVGYQLCSLELASEDMIILTSDGVVEAKNDRGHMLGFERLEDIIRRGPITSATDMLKYIKSQVQLFTEGEEQHDDITIVVVRM